MKAPDGVPAADIETELVTLSEALADALVADDADTRGDPEKDGSVEGLIVTDSRLDGEESPVTVAVSHSDAVEDVIAVDDETGETE